MKSWSDFTKIIFCLLIGIASILVSAQPDNEADNTLPGEIGHASSLPKELWGTVLTYLYKEKSPNCSLNKDDLRALLFTNRLLYQNLGNLQNQIITLTAAQIKTIPDRYARSITHLFLFNQHRGKKKDREGVLKTFEEETLDDCIAAYLVKFARLQYLVIDDITIKNLHFLYNLSSLKHLSIINCKSLLPSSFSALKNHRSLVHLSIKSCNVNKLDFLEDPKTETSHDPQAKKLSTSLKSLELVDTHLVTLEGLQHCAELTTLKLTNVFDKDLQEVSWEPLNTLSNLQKLYLCQKLLSNLLCFNKLSGLKQLELALTNSEQFNSLEGIENLHGLEILKLSDRSAKPKLSAEEFHRLSCLSKLISLNIYHLNFTDPSIFFPLLKLEELSIDGYAFIYNSKLSGLKILPNLRKLKVSKPQNQNFESGLL